MRLGLYGLNMFACADPMVALEVALIQGCAILWPPSHRVKTSHVIRPEPEWPVGSAGQPFVHKGRRP